MCIEYCVGNIEHRDLEWCDSGQVALSGDLLRLHSLLDQRFVSMCEELPVSEHRFPSFLDVKNLKKMDYLHSFPQHVTFPVVLSPDKENLQAFRCGNIYSDRDEIQLTNVQAPKQILTPAACYHFYGHFKNSNLNGVQYLTTVATCYRREEYYKPLERQWNFNMRELVCIGGHEEVTDFLQNITEKVIQLLTDLGLNVELEDATDAFFDPSNNPKFVMQKLQPNKKELVFAGELAIGSINFHRNYFGEAFSIRKNQEYAFSGCVAFGLERWLAAIIRQYGGDKENWPALLQHALTQETSDGGRRCV